MVYIVVVGITLAITLAIVIDRVRNKIKLLEIELAECRKDIIVLNKDCNMLGRDYMYLKDRIEVLEDSLVE